MNRGNYCLPHSIRARILSMLALAWLAWHVVDTHKKKNPGEGKLRKKINNIINFIS